MDSMETIFAYLFVYFFEDFWIGTLISFQLLVISCAGYKILTKQPSLMKKWFDPSILWLLASFSTVPSNMAQSSIMWLHEERPIQSKDVGIQLNYTANSYRNLITDFGDGGGSGSISDPSLISYTINASIATVTTTVAVLPNNHDDYDPKAYYGPVFSKLNFEYRSIHGYLSLVVCVFGIIANVLNIIVLTRRNMESPTNTILTGMAVSDLLVIASYIPYVIHNYIRTEVPPEQMYNYGWAVFTLFHAHNTVLFHTISIWLTVLLAVWRYITVRTPMRTRSMLTIVQARLYIMLVYIMVPVFCIPVFISFTIQPMSWPDQHRNISIYKVDIVQIEGKNHYLLEKITFWVFSVFLKLIPCLLLTCITLALIKILMEARRRKERLLKGNLNQQNARNSNAVGLDKNNSNQILATPTTQPSTTFSSNHLHPNQHQHRHSQPTNSLTPRSGRNLKATNPNNNININTRNNTNTNNRQNSVHLEMETCFECDQSSSSCKTANSSSESTCSTTLNPNSNNDNGPNSFSKLCFHCGNCLQSTKRKLTPTTTAIKTDYPKTSTAAQSTQSKSRTVANNSKQNPKNNKIKLKFRSSGRSTNNCSLSSTTMTTTTTMAGNPTSGTATTTTATTTTGNPSSSSSSSSSGNSERTTKMLIAVLIMFLVCEFPSGILALLSGILGKNFFKNVYNNFGDIMDMLALINSAVNFVLYCLMSQQFRKTFSHLFCIRWTEEISVGQQHSNAVASGAVGMIRRTSGSILGRNRTASIVQQQQPPQPRKLHAHHHQMKQHEEITTTEFIEINDFDSNENGSTKNTNNMNDGSNEDSAAADGKNLQGKPTPSSNNNTSNNNCLTNTGPEMPPSTAMTTITESPVIKNNDQNDGNIMMVAIKNPGYPTNDHCGPSSTVLAATTTAVTNTNTRPTEIITTVNGNMNGDNDHEKMNCSTSV